MHLIDPAKHTRRAFLRRAGQLAFTGAALPTAMNLAAMGEAAAFNATDYKALVCVFLFGGNDYANTVINYDPTTHGQYATIRGGISIPRASLAATALTPTTPLPDGVQYALHPSMTGLAGLFNGGKAAVQLNVGPLVVPLTRQQYNSSNRT
nr:Tat pathway signal protein [Hydrogenophaga sp.]